MKLVMYELWILLVIVTTCEGGPDGCSENYTFAYMHTCIAVVPTTHSSHLQARKSCFKIGGDLLIIKNEKMQAYVNHILLPYGVNTWHIGGLRDPIDEDAFDVSWQGKRLQYNNFGPEGVRNSMSTCIALISGSVYDGTWYDYPCELPAMSICATPRNYTHELLGCDKNYHKSYNGMCIALMTTRLRREQAESVCVKMRGHLLTIRSKEMEVFLNQIIPHNTKEPSVWFIDGYESRTDSHDYLDWSGQQIQYPNWTSKAYSSDRCLVLYNGSGISQWNCLYHNMFLCGKKIAHAHDLSHEVHSSNMTVVYILISVLVALVILVMVLVAWKPKRTTRTEGSVPLVAAEQSASEHHNPAFGEGVEQQN